MRRGHVKARHILLEQSPQAIHTGGRGSVQLLQDQITKRFIVPLPVGHGGEGFLCQLGGFPDFVLPQQLPDAGQAFPGIRVYPAAKAGLRGTGPDRNRTIADKTEWGKQ